MEKDMDKEVTGLSVSAIKGMAVASMTLDHLAVVVLAPYFFAAGAGPGGQGAGWEFAYTLLRCLGRVAFPLFCFLLTEGFLHTRSSVRYALRLFVFSLLSEPIFDLATAGSWIDLRHQNVFFTLILGLCSMAGVRYFSRRVFFQALSAVSCCLAAWLLRADYGAWGVLLITVLYLLHQDRRWQLFGGLAACLASGEAVIFRIFQMLGIALISRYNGRRGKGGKYFFYLYYPAHLWILYGIHIFLPTVPFVH